MRSCHYILDDQRRIVPVDLLTWAEWFERPEARRVAETMCGDYRVSTVFLGLDHNFSDGGPPILWETMVFRGRKKVTIRPFTGEAPDDPDIRELVELLRSVSEAMAGEYEIECSIDTLQLRCAGGWEQAEAMHAEAVERVEAVRALALPSAPEPPVKNSSRT